MPVCPKCGAQNQPDNQFCLSCGADMSGAGDGGGAAVPSIDDLMQAGVVCPECDAYNDAGLTECISCGASLHGMTGFMQAVTSPPAQSGEETVVEKRSTPPTPPVAPEPELPAAQPQAPAPAPAESAGPAAAATPVTRPQMPAATSQPTPRSLPAIQNPPTPAAQAPAAPAERKQTGELHSPAQQSSPPAASGGLCPHCRANMPNGAQVCLACGKRVGPATADQGTAADMSIRLRLVRGYGQEDSTFPVGPTGVTVGRSGCMISIADDPFLSPTHLVMRLAGGQLVAEDQGSLNGTFIRVRAQCEIKQGAEFVSGNQRFCLLGLGGPTTDVRMPLSQDTRAYGGPTPKQLFVALRLNHADGEGKPLAGSVILRRGPVITVGQSGCDLSFPKDPAMSPKQFELHLKPSGIQLVESGTSSGVYLRATGPVSLHNGDELMVGDEVFRVEIG